MSEQDRGLALLPVLVVAAVAVPVGIYGYSAVRDAVGDETLRSDVRSLIALEALCNADRHGVGYSAGSNLREPTITLHCGSAIETLRPSSGNRLVVSVNRDGSGYSILGLRPDTGFRVRFDSASGRWS